MIIKRKKNYDATSKELPIVHHSHKRGEMSRFVKAFHSGCKHIKERMVGSAAIEYGPNVSKNGRVEIKV